MHGLSLKLQSLMQGSVIVGFCPNLSIRGPDTFLFIILTIKLLGIVNDHKGVKFSYKISLILMNFEKKKVTFDGGPSICVSNPVTCSQVDMSRNKP